ncbi:MAG: hypothetical protein M3Z04_22665 [Chloroflexota bacterium]|nr:hypothetical protein [Chloroflexota bacterium]
MRFLPYEHFTIDTRLAPHEVRARLAAQLRREARANSWRVGAPYTGWVRAADFQISPMTAYRHAYLPIMRGAIRPTTAGSTLEIVMQLQEWVLAIGIAWMGLSVVLSIMIVGGSLRDPSLLAACIIPGAMVVFGYGAYNIGFRGEAARAAEFLSDLLAHRSGVSSSSVSHPTQRLPLLWGGHTPAAQRYGWGVESPPLPPVAEGAEHETQRLPPVVR